MFGPDNLIWELDKASATAENVLGRTRGKSSGARGDGSVIYDDAVGRTPAGALVNGKAVPLHYAFKNGDVFDVAAAA